MADFDLLDAILPEEGRYCLVGIGRYVDQRFASTREEAEEQINLCWLSRITFSLGAPSMAS